MSQAICLTAESEEKRKRLAALREELADLYEKREFMITYERDQLIALYTKLIGQLQYEEFALKITVQKQKRTSELIQAKRNRGEKVIMSDIQRQVEKEYAEYQKKLQEQLEQLRLANEILAAPVLSEEDAAELKSLYRLLVKRLHPDWNPEQTETEKELFLRAKAAYKMCDLQELRNILMMLDKKSPLDDLKADGIDDELMKLEKSLQDIRLRIDQLNETFPFTYRERLHDFAWVEAEQEQIRHRIAALQAEKKTWDEFLSAITNSKPTE